MSTSRRDKDLVKRENNEAINPLRTPTEAIIKAVRETKIAVDDTIYESNLRGKLEKATARVRIETDDNSPYKFLL
jgi:hypothetical protein